MKLDAESTLVKRIVLAIPVLLRGAIYACGCPLIRSCWNGVWQITHERFFIRSSARFIEHNIHSCARFSTRTCKYPCDSHIIQASDVIAVGARVLKPIWRWHRSRKNRHACWYKCWEPSWSEGRGCRRCTIEVDDIGKGKVNIRTVDADTIAILTLRTCRCVHVGGYLPRYWISTVDRFDKVRCYCIVQSDINLRALQQGGACGRERYCQRIPWTVNLTACARGEERHIVDARCRWGHCLVGRH